LLLPNASAHLVKELPQLLLGFLQMVHRLKVILPPHNGPIPSNIGPQIFSKIQLLNHLLKPPRFLPNEPVVLHAAVTVWILPLFL
jgi:hypothetical protein